ncbi:acetyl-CoA carboxylase biotin carboxyl carrier protein subunit [Lactiplantibacillus garii]|uniref:Acetyl-CoA carboxylase biotin carboxyl carrier protein subunit n=1 Tax=Lactiplantibacillus garii TaxID=2306423 RepID=A0A3R8J699_9LACO|nr:acetyl-CoA carboxylase biotin carboxyl carrier protein subunit [Lactiplantibacillus garii]RRK09632.1 acetyl-CoA carboxylase biotin carboxyl carrier protein subunit [Lactiplantibacillus garii]
MLRKFKITIDGKEYLVEMEEIGGTATPAAPAPQPVQATPTVAPASAAPQPEPAAAPTPAASGDTSDAMKAPMPGTIIKMLVAPGDQVTENQPLLVLEAMKMENEIVANRAGTVAEIFVNKNDTVNAGDALITIS